MPPITPVRLDFPLMAFAFQRYAAVVAGGVLTLVHDAAQDFAYYVYQATHANGDTFTHVIYLAAGSYTLNALGITKSTYGKLDWYIDNVLAVSGQDWYSAGDVYNVVKTAAVTVVGSGQHTLKGVVNGHNGASGGYYISLTAIALY
jgi:hypothetical protein